jgi:hypothetical protein
LEREGMGKERETEREREIERERIQFQKNLPPIHPVAPLLSIT